VSSSDHSQHIPRTRDGTPNWAADTDPVGPVTPELALVDPELSRGEIDNEVTMSSIQFGDAQTPVEGQPVMPLQPLEPLQPLQPLQPLAPPAPAPEAAAPAPVEPAPAVPVSDMRDVPLGTLVFRAGLLPEERLEEALQEGMKTGKRLGEILLERGWVSEVDLGRLLAGQKGLPFIELDPATIDPTAPPLLHPEKARLHGALPIGFEGGVPVVAVADPSNDLVVENVRRALACEPVLVVAGRDALGRAINQAYGAEPAAPATPEPVVEQAPAPPVVEPQAAPVVEPQAPPQPAPVVEAPVAPAAPVVPQPVEPQPVAEPVQPTPDASGNGVWIGQQQEPVAAPVAPPEPVAEVFVPEPQVVQPEVVPAAPAVPEVVVPTQPEPEPEPVAEATPAPGVDLTWTVVLRLADGERLEVGSFAGEAEALEGARSVVAQISADGSWPFFSGRFIRPEAIVSVDLVQLEVSRWLGSQARAAAWSDQQPSQ
jgi:Type II secretion system (T2SS), protein E, N-terminal domain